VFVVLRLVFLTFFPLLSDDCGAVLGVLLIPFDVSDSILLASVLLRVFLAFVASFFVFSSVDDDPDDECDVLERVG